jgi:hypothetical protein
MAITRSLRVLVRIWVISIWVLGAASAQAATPGPMVTLPSGETVWDLTGDWDALTEHFGPNVSLGTYINVHRFTQTGRVFSAIRLKDNPPPAPGEAGNPVWRGEMDKGGFKRVEMISSQGSVSPIKGQISEDGKKIVIDDGWSIKVTLTRQ